MEVECRRPTRWPGERVKKELQGWGRKPFLNLRQGILQTSNVTFILQALFSNSCTSNLTCPFQQKYYRTLIGNWNRSFYPRIGFNIESKCKYKPVKNSNKTPCLIVHIYRSVVDSVLPTHYERDCKNFVQKFMFFYLTK